MAVKFFGQYLVEQGAVKAEAIVKAIELQEKTNLKLGEQAVVMGLATADDIERAHRSQLSKDLKLGDLLVATGVLSQKQLDEVVARQKADHLFIGEALVHIGALDPAELKQRLDEFKADQAPYLAERVALPAGVPHSAVWEVAVDLTYKLVTRVLGLKYRAGACREVDALAASHVIAAMDISGDARARYLISLSAAGQESVARAILRQESVTAEPVEVLEDCVMEFVNVVCGNVVAKVSQDGIALGIAPPLVIHPDGKPVALPAGSRALSFPLHLEDGDLIELYLVLPA